MKLRPALAALLVLGSAGEACAQAPDGVRVVARALSAGACEQLAALAVPHVKVTLAKPAAAGAFEWRDASPGPVDLSSFFGTVPAFCRVVAKSAPTPDSDISIELWIPMDGWNGKLQGIGNGGFAGDIDYMRLARGVRSGYATVATDTGHKAAPTDASWALGHPEKVIDFGHRAIHEMTAFAKEAIRSAYGAGPLHSYFASCSDGGREALMEAQRYPADYDGIVAGAPAYDWTHLLVMAVVDSQALLKDPASYIPADRVPAIAAAVRAACDEQDGVRDGIVDDPRTCRFDPARIACAAGASAQSCLTPQQIAALGTIYDGLRNSSGESIFPGYSPGAEEGPEGWSRWITGPTPGKSRLLQFGTGYFSNMVYEKADWDYKTLVQETALADARRKTGAALDATNPDLTAFMNRGGKLVLHHGWADPAIPPMGTVRYYENVRKTMGAARADSFVRLFMMPGVQHCAGGPAPDDVGQRNAPGAPDALHNVNVAIEQWVERGLAPARLIATRPAPAGRPFAQPATRLLCPYPQVAKYKGTGDTNHAANYECGS